MDENEDALGPNPWSAERNRQPPKNYQADFSALKYPA